MTKTSLYSVKDELEDKKKIIHVITSNINNTLISTTGNKETVQQLRDIMTKINKDEGVHNINYNNKKLNSDDSNVKDYLKQFSCN
ncbi:hypothetical protein WH06_24555 [Aeromonas salmonicida subsp. salmonicida]|uniref:Uncharacterized protein n=1 Tax=Aeromonas salmonicida subsp. salmonicida 01-B526 TaxID=1076135 RepID=A0ABN0DUW0_AERSS|nr:hypothetical protein CE456_02735 [Aeromonas salmonicida]ATD37100.1 hypothetical protein BHG40_03325 [Aeromonas salmonicida subsp. masoucida]AYO65068.1 hypothetical protein C5P03_21290 [Aeromonas salmonicida subsp. salmonicida 01-B526]KHE95893.1 hypothetical protein NX85_20660 [Aeromonas salmonicida subsp. salmonicida]GAJ50228.1 hypothetical protein ASA01S_079_00150 [Aeromonas salmonicida subsp. masoucida NBRC 13784]